MKKIIAIIILLAVLLGIYLFIKPKNDTSKEDTLPESEVKVVVDEEEEVIPEDTGDMEEEVVEEGMEIEETEEAAEVVGSVVEVDVVATNFEYDIQTITANVGDTVRINLINEEGFHDWVIDELNVSTDTIEAGEEETLEFVVSEAGEYEYYCSVGNHRELGMVGTLIVE